MARQKVIVTGGMGYIGSHTVVELISAGYQPIIIDNLSNSRRSVLDGISTITGEDVPFEEVDLSVASKTFEVFEKYADAIGVIHFAALKAVGESVEKPTLYYKNNLFSLINVIEAIQKNNIDKFIFSSSCTVYGQPDQLPVTELSPIQPAASPYGNTKQIGEEILRETTSATNSKLVTTSLRYFNPIGAHASAHIGELPLGIPSNLLPYLTQTVAGIREQLSVFGSDYNTPDGTAIRDYIHVVDVAEAHIIALQRLIEGKNKSNYEAYNLGTGEGYSVLDVIHSFERSTGQKVNYKIVDRRPGDVEAVYADTSLAMKELNWMTKRSLDEMTSSAWEWQKKVTELRIDN